jgi:hypothetical protein
MAKRVVQDATREKNQSQEFGPDDIIAAFDRQREAAQEFNRRHTDHVRNSRAGDRQVLIDRRRRPR